MIKKFYKSIASVTSSKDDERDDMFRSLEDDVMSPQTSNSIGDSPALLSPITSIDSYNQMISKSIERDQAAAAAASAESKDSLGHPSEIERKVSSIFDLPIEVLMRIIEFVYFDTDFDSINKILENFKKISMISNYFHLISLKFLYKYAIFNRPQSFEKFLNNLKFNNNLGKFVQFIDFQTFTSIGLGRTGKMNQEIQMVTSDTILKCLTLTPNLIEFLASENIQDDLDGRVLHFLFNNLHNLQGLDFCGASSEQFRLAFNSLWIENPLKKLFKISFHDCSNLSADVFEKVLPNLINLRRLDLTHTPITSSILLHFLPQSCNLTHLSLGKCSKITTRDLINFLLNHPAVSNHQLRWLNLSVDSNVISPLSENYLYFTLNHLNADNLEYLNLGGLSMNARLLNLINVKFPNLKTLSINHSGVDFDDVYDFLNNNNSILNIDLTGCKLTRLNIISLIQFPNLISIECDNKLLKNLTINQGQFIKVNDIIWRFHDNDGRRSWVYKLFPGQLEYSQILQYGKLINLNVTYYDTNTGEKIVQKSSKPIFLKYVGRKINCSIGFKNLNYCKTKEYLNNYENNESPWPEEFCERGIYNYYSLNI